MVVCDMEQKISGQEIIVLPVIGNLEVQTLRAALENYFLESKGDAKTRNCARSLFRRLNKEVQQ